MVISFFFLSFIPTSLRLHFVFCVVCICTFQTYHPVPETTTFALISRNSKSDLAPKIKIVKRERVQSTLINIVKNLCSTASLYISGFCSCSSDGITKFFPLSKIVSTLLTKTIGENGRSVTFPSLPGQRKWSCGINATHGQTLDSSAFRKVQTSDCWMA